MFTADLGYAKGNGGFVPLSRHLKVFGGCTCGEGQLFPLRLRQGVLAMPPDPKTLQRPLPGLC